ncbi:MAG: 2OG-Fe(II) oxygenase [Sphingomicrobium sp.]
MSKGPANNSSEDRGSTAFDQAMAILASRASVDEVRNSAALLSQASAAGNGAASERLAVVTAMGLIASPDWERALDLLALAARQGDQQASEQLQLLAEPARYPIAALDLPAIDALRAGIDLDARLSAPAAETVRAGPLIRHHSGFATRPECDWLIRSALAKLQPATVFDKDSGEQIEHPVRSNHSVCYQIADLELLAEVMRARISAATRVPIPFFEPPQVFRYAVGEQFREHVDYFDPSIPGYDEEIAQHGQRVGTFLLYLNDEYTGGETAFPACDLNWRGRAGDGLFFANVDRDGQPDRRAVHAGTPPTSGEKWILSQWIRDRVPVA